VLDIVCGISNKVIISLYFLCGNGKNVWQEALACLVPQIFHEKSLRRKVSTLINVIEKELS